MYSDRLIDIFDMGDKSIVFHRSCTSSGFRLDDTTHVALSPRKCTYAVSFWLIWDVVPKSLWNQYLSIICYRLRGVSSLACVISPPGYMASHTDIIFNRYMYLYVILIHIKYEVNVTYV